MSDRHFHPKRRVFSGSNVLWAIGTALSQIKDEDDLTDADIGAVLGKCADQARAYRRQEAMMDAEAFGRAKREWGGRFTGPFDRLCADSRPAKTDDRAALTVLLECSMRLSKALEDGDIAPEEVRDNRSVIEETRDMLEAQLRKLGPTDTEAA